MRLKSSKATRKRWGRFTSFALIAGLALSPMAANAASITESFTVAAQNNFDASVDSFIPTSKFAQFNPSMGTLTSITAGVGGDATWSSNYSGSILVANIVDNYYNDIGTPPNYGFQEFIYTGPIGISLFNSASGANDIIGTGQTKFYLGLNSNAVMGDTVQFTTAGLDGNITYNYTPYTPVPEPGSLLLLASGLFGLAIIRRRKII